MAVNIFDGMQPGVHATIRPPDLTDPSGVRPAFFDHRLVARWRALSQVASSITDFAKTASGAGPSIIRAKMPRRGRARTDSALPLISIASSGCKDPSAGDTLARVAAPQAVAIEKINPQDPAIFNADLPCLLEKESLQPRHLRARQPEKVDNCSASTQTLTRGSRGNLEQLLSFGE